MKKLLSILSTFTVVSAIAFTVVACKSDSLSLESLVKEIAADENVKNAAKEYGTAISGDEAGKKIALDAAIGIKFRVLIAEKLKGKKEVEAVLEILNFVNGKMNLEASKGTDKVTIKLTKEAWKDDFTKDDAKRADIKATYESISGSSTEADISTKA